MRLPGLVNAAVLLLCAGQAAARALSGKPTDLIWPYEDKVLQDIVTWDDHSIFVHGERVMFYSGEYHPFRLPNPSLWLDVFQKIKALGYNGVSFYVDWALLEGKPGEFTAEGVFAWEPFFDAAQKAGIYLLARPGPYINAEVSGGGFPGWLQRVKGILRTPAPSYIDATANYVKNIGEIIAKAQITNGGPVILFQPENEYSGATDDVVFPSAKYMNTVMKQYRDAGLIVPFISNDACDCGHNAPGDKAAVDIYGHDGYPLGFDCANPTVWPEGALPTDWRTVHEEQSPTTPYSIIEFQGGSFDPWGGLGFEQCAALVNNEFERVFYKNNFGFGVTVFNIYMTFGGTNWGNLGHPGGYTSYDYGAPIMETREVTREKYSEAKLDANFLMASPAYLTAIPQNASFEYTNKGSKLRVAPLLGKTTNFFVIRHGDYRSQGSINYKATLPTSQGNVTIPQMQGHLTLHGRDSKIHVTDYQVGDFNMLYSSAEVFTWKKYSDKTVLVLYGGQDEAHELAFTNLPKGKVSAPTGVAWEKQKDTTIINWATEPMEQVVKLPGNLYVYLLDRNTAYNFWAVDVPITSETPTPHALIVKAGYLVRSASVSGGTIALTGDVNATTSIEVVGGAPSKVSKLTFNGKTLDHKTNEHGAITATVAYTKPKVSLPDLSTTAWYYKDTLPELESDYDDSSWTVANEKTSNNPRELTTPTSLYSSDYGYHTGTLLYRGHFKATGVEKTLKLVTQGGSAFGMSAWLGSKYLGKYNGIDAASNATNTFTLPDLTKGKAYVVTVVIDNMGLNEDWVVGTDEMKLPRGILNYELSGRKQSAVTWKLTGNLGGEDYVDKVRGPLNEGGLWAERHGYHQPSPPVSGWTKQSGGPITKGIDKAGVGWFVTKFDLDMPQGYDTPLSFTFSNSSSTVKDYRVQLYVNGWQFGKYVNNVGPQTDFPVQEGILNYQGENWVAVSLWSLDAAGAKIEGLELNARHPVLTGYKGVENVESPAWKSRKGAY